MKNLSRRRFLQFMAATASSAALGTLLPSCGADGGGGENDGAVGGNLSGLRAIDAHAHPDQFISSEKTDLSCTLAGIVSMKIAASSFSAVGDRSGDKYASAMSQLAYPLALADQGKVKIVSTIADIPLESSQAVPPGAILSLEGGDAIYGDLAKLKAFYDVGVRLMTLVHYTNNELGDIMMARVGSDPGPYFGGLTPKGVEVIQKMESLGMVVDVAHASRDTLTDICGVVTKPFIDSHTSPSPTETPTSQTRLRSWAEMEMIVQKDGVICLWPCAYGGAHPRSTFSDWAQEIVAMKAAFGIEHVALGTDGSGSLPAMINGYSGVSDLWKLKNAMLEAGLSQSDIKAFFGGNMLRVLTAVIG